MQTNIDVLTKLRKEKVLFTNRVIRNTYILLSLTILFSALITYISLILNVKPLNFILILVLYFGLLYFININKNNILGIIGVFLFTGFIGYTLAPYINFILHKSYGGKIIFISLFSTGLLFLSLSFYALISKKNFNFLGAFLFTGCIIIFFAFIVSMFYYIPLLHIVISACLIILSSGFILYETSNLIHGDETNYVIATISLYLQIYNIFISLLSILNFFSNRE